MEKSESKLMHIKYVFTTEEKKENAFKMATDISEKEAKDEERQEVASKYAYEMKALTSRINIYAQELRQGYTYKNHPCYEKFDRVRNQVTVHRSDTDEQIEIRTMTAEEMQPDLFNPREEIKDDPDADLTKDEEIPEDGVCEASTNPPKEFLNDKPVE